jgi:hypothetical protein
MADPRSRLAAGVLAVVCAAAAVPAHADDGRDLLQSYSVITSMFYETGHTEYSAYRSDWPVTPTGMGIRYFERRGIISGTLAAIAMVAGSAAAQSGPKSSRSWESGGYKYTETTYYSDAEKRQMNERASRTGANLASSRDQSFELQIYSRNLGGSTSGFRTNLFLYGGGGESWYFETGFGGATLQTAASDNGRYLITHAPYLGMPFKFNYATKFCLTYLQFDWNWYGHSTPTADDHKGATLISEVRGAMPWRLGAAFTVMSRIYGEVAIVTPKLTAGQFGVNANVGLRF